MLRRLGKRFLPYLILLDSSTPEALLRTLHFQQPEFQIHPSQLVAISASPLPLFTIRSFGGILTTPPTFEFPRAHTTPLALFFLSQPPIYLLHLGHHKNGPDDLDHRWEGC